MNAPRPTASRMGTTAAQRQQWPELLAHNERWLRLVVLARVGERQAVDEVMQEVALAAVSQRNVPSDPAKLPAWLYRIAVRQALLFRRRVGRRRRLADRYADRRTQGDAFESDPLDWLLRDERNRLVREALRRLPAGDTQCLLLKYVENWGAREVAAHLGVSVSAAEARLHRARQRLRDELSASLLTESVKP